MCAPPHANKQRNEHICESVNFASNDKSTCDKYGEQAYVGISEESDKKLNLYKCVKLVISFIIFQVNKGRDSKTRHGYTKTV